MRQFENYRFSKSFLPSRQRAKWFEKTSFWSSFVSFTYLSFLSHKLIVKHQRSFQRPITMISIFFIFFVDAQLKLNTAITSFSILRKQIQTEQFLPGFNNFRFSHVNRYISVQILINFCHLRKTQRKTIICLSIESTLTRSVHRRKASGKMHFTANDSGQKKIFQRK